MGSDDLEIDRVCLDDGSLGHGRKGYPAPAVSAVWYNLRARPWRTLALVAPVNGSRAWRLAHELRAVEGARPRGIHVVNALDATVGRVAAITHALSPKKLESRTDQLRFIVAADSPLVNPVAIGLLTTCDAVVLLLERRRTRIPDAQRILELVGSERFIGAVLCPG